MKPSTEQSGQNKVEDLPPFGAPVLEPGLDLGVGHFEEFGQRRPFGRRQIFLLVEPLLQLAHLFRQDILLVMNE